VKGELKGLNGQSSDDSVLLIQKLEAIASEWAIGRDMHIGDTIVGIKGRVAFEAAAALITIKAHHTLEKHTLTKWQQYWKEQLASWYGMMLHEAMYLEPALRDIEKMLENSQQFVTGTVTVRLMPYHFLVVGIESEHDMMRSGFGEYGEMNNAWSGDDVVGFTKIISNQLKIYNKVNNVF
jgi:argininosuccinate synthase